MSSLVLMYVLELVRIYLVTVSDVRYTPWQDTVLNITETILLNESFTKDNGRMNFYHKHYEIKYPKLVNSQL